MNDFRDTVRIGDLMCWTKEGRELTWPQVYVNPCLFPSLFLFFPYSPTTTLNPHPHRLFFLPSLLFHPPYFPLLHSPFLSKKTKSLQRPSRSPKGGRSREWYTSEISKEPVTRKGKHWVQTSPSTTSGREIPTGIITPLYKGWVA